MKNKETFTDEHYLREVSEKLKNQCPICGSESSFEIKKGRYTSALSVCSGMMLTCKTCSAEWYVDRPFFVAGEIKGLILKKPDLKGHAKKYLDKIRSPEWWVEMNLAGGHVKRTYEDFEKDRLKLEDWKKKRPLVIKQWSELAEKNPRLTQEELKEIYIGHYPDDKDIERYLKERQREKAEIEKKESPYLKGIHDILLVFLSIFIILLVVSCLGTCI